MPEGSLPPKPPTIPKRPTYVPGGATAAQKEVASMLDTQPIVIRTMQDDLRAARGEKPRATATAAIKTPALPRPAKPEGRSGDKGETGGLAISAPPVPLPPKSSAQKVIVPPPIKRRRRSHAVAWLMTLLVLAIGGGGAAGWWFFGDRIGLPNPWRAPMAKVMPIANVLPNASSFIVSYQASSAEERGRLISAWNKAGRGEASLASLLSGDPRWLLAEAEITSFYYVFLEDDTRPYLVVPQSRRSKELLVDKPEARLAAIEGWYVVSSVSTDPYRSALAAGPLVQPPGNIFSDQIAATPPSSADLPLRIFVGPHALISLRENLLGSNLGNGRLQEVSLAGRWAGSAPALEVSGRAVTLEAMGGSASAPATADKQANQQLLSLVPETATLVHLGSNFQQDLAGWAASAGALDVAVLQQPSVAAFIEQLQGSYAFYGVSPNAATHDIGVIISLSPALRAQLRIPAPTIEEALSALLPLLTGRKGVAPIEFTSHTHAGVALRYANFSQPTQALDYALVDTYLVIATSREAMFTLLETIQGAHAPVASSAAWQPLLSAWGALPATTHLVIGTVVAPPLTQVFPVGSDQTPLFGLAMEPAADGMTVSGIVVLPAP